MATTMKSQFAGSCTRCHSRFPAGTVIVWTRGAGAYHANASQCLAPVIHGRPVAAPAPAAVIVNLKSVSDFLNAAKARGLKFPNCRFLAPDGGELRLHVAGTMSKAPGAVQVKHDGNWIGRVEVDGKVIGRLAGMDATLAELRVIAADPAKAAKAYGALHCRCSFCNLPLSDAGSVEVGYGPVCAKHWGLPHKPKGAPVLTTVGVEYKAFGPDYFAAAEFNDDDADEPEPDWDEDCNPADEFAAADLSEDYPGQRIVGPEGR